MSCRLSGQLCSGCVRASAEGVARRRHLGLALSSCCVEGDLPWGGERPNAMYHLSMLAIEPPQVGKAKVQVTSVVESAQHRGAFRAEHLHDSRPLHALHALLCCSLLLLRLVFQIEPCQSCPGPCKKRYLSCVSAQDVHPLLWLHRSTTRTLNRILSGRFHCCQW